MHPLMVHHFSIPTQKHMQSSISIARLLPRQLHQAHSEVFIRVPGLVPATRHCHHQKPAGSTLAEGVLLLQMLDSGLHRSELHPFFRITDCSASLSRLRSATSLRNRVFSSRNCLASCASLTSIPPYFAFQA